MSWVAVSVTAVAALASAYAAYESGQAQKEAADFNKDVARNNAISARYQSAEEARRLRDRNERLRGTQRAIGAKSGIDISSGTFIDVLNDSAIQGEMDALTALYTGKVDVNRSMSQAKLFGMEASAANRGSYINAGVSLLNGASGSYGKYSDSRQGKTVK